jgi:uncharacterized protein with HEPN domain
MNRNQQRVGDYLAHILEAIERIDRYTKLMDESAFLDNPLVQDAVIRNFEIIGEASNNIGKFNPEFAAANPKLPLAFAYQMRNALVHGYFHVDLKIVWRTIQSDLPDLHARVQSAMIACQLPDAK